MFQNILNFLFVTHAGEWAKHLIKLLCSVTGELEIFEEWMLNKEKYLEG